MTKYEKISLAISIALLILSYGFAGAQPRLAKIAASLAIFRLLAVAPYPPTQSAFDEIIE